MKGGPASAAPASDIHIRKGKPVRGAKRRLILPPNSFYLPCTRSITGGNVSSRAAATIIAATVLTRFKLTSRAAHLLARTSHDTSHTAMARSVTPESGPVGIQISKKAAAAGLASPARLKMPRAREPSAAAMIAAAPLPFLSARGGNSFIAVTAPQYDEFVAPAHGCILVEHRAEKGRCRGGKKGDGDKADHRLPHAAVPPQLAAIFQEDIGHRGQADGGKPGQMFFPFHPDVVPACCRRIGHQEPLRIRRQVGCSRHGTRAIPGI